ncbi:MAG: alpha/beta fold hydrolase [Bacteroidota bacterium]
MLKRRLAKVFLTGVIFYVIASFILYFFQEKFIFHPYKLDSDHSFAFSADFEELNFTTQDNEQISAVHFKKENPKGILLFFHGNTGNIQVCGPFAYPFLDQGWDVLVFDYRSFGKSSGELTLDNLLNDGHLAYEYAMSHFEENKIIIYGQSLGTGIARSLASNYNPQLLVLEAPYYSLKHVAQKQFPFMPISLLLKYNLNNAEYLKKVKCPIRVFHGTDDQTIPIENSRLLKSEFPRIMLHELKSIGHNDVNSHPAYWNNLTFN